MRAEIRTPEFSGCEFGKSMDFLYDPQWRQIVEIGGFWRKIDGFESNQRVARVQRHRIRSEMIPECLGNAYGA